MKLKDLVANSLPRVRGRKKKTPGTVGAATPTAEAVVTADILTSRGNLDKGKHRLQPVAGKSDSHDDSFELQGITEASWRGNALYRGLEAARAVKFNSKLMSTSYTSSHGMVTSRSAEGFSSQMMMSRSYDSRMTVPDCSDSCPQILSVCDSRLEPFSSAQQYYHCHYHQHSHHHYYHHHHLHPKVMAPLAQNQQKLQPEVAAARCLSSSNTPEEVKPEQGFFRKSFASFRSMRKHSKSHKDLKHNGVEKTVCSVCPYPEATATSSEKKSTEKRPAKPKRKSLKGLAKHKENKDVMQSDKSWYSDNDTHNVVGSVTAGTDPSVSALATRERQHDRERSVESCSSRLFGSREGSSVREVDFTGFDSASLSGYESDLPRGKVHRSRSRIKTNPWLPSPQPSVSGGVREQFDLRESTEDVITLEESTGKFPRSASFDHQRSGKLLMQNSLKKDSNDNKIAHRPRSVTPSDNKITVSLAPQGKTPAPIAKPALWAVNQESDESFGLKKTPKPKVEIFNDLSTASKSRPSSTVSPNSEFVMLADNLEQLANNISFEYEEMLDTTLESVSICQEDGQTSIQELLTDEENVEVSQTSLKSDGDLHNAHSPDSGVGGLGSTDGDDNMVPNSQRLQTDLSMDSLQPSDSIRCFTNRTGSDSNLELSVCSKVGHFRRDKSCGDAKCSSFLLAGACDYNTQTASPKLKLTRDKFCLLETSSSTTLSESDIDNTSYHTVCTNEHQNKKVNATKCHANVFPGKQYNSLPLRNESELVYGSKTAKLMVDERLDIEFQPAHRQFHGCGIVMGTGGAMHEHAQTGASGKQMLWKSSDSPAMFTCRHPRPCAFKTSPGLAVLRKMNDIEKGSTQGQSRGSWSGEFDIPRNITATECVESPTENWQCLDGFSVSRNTETLAHSQITPQSEVPEGKPAQAAASEGNFLPNEELVVNLTSVVETARYNHQGTIASEMGSRLDYTLGKQTIESDSSCSDMNDACVQTDFDEDFWRWEGAETLESLEEKALDPAESTRLWLLTGNMQDSTDTGYSSLTRESQILMDEDTLFLAGEMEETAAAHRLSFVESSEVRTAVDTPSKDNDSRVMDKCKTTDYERNSQPPDTSKCAVFVDKEQPRQLSGRGTKPGIKKERVATELLSLSDISGQQSSHSPRVIPHSTVHRMFSNIESQFEQLFQKIQDDKSNAHPATKRLSSDSSDSTLKSDTEGHESRSLSKTSRECVKSQDPEAVELKAGMPSVIRAGKDFLRTPSSVSKTFPLRVASQQVHCARHAKETTVNKCIDFTQPKHELPSYSCKCGPFKNPTLCNPVAGSSPVPVGHERADYLEFLRDAPLDRLHLKRPLFLVPGVGPVDMSSSEQLNLFSDPSMPDKKSPLPVSAVTSSPSPASMSPSTAHCGKKVKYKKGDHQTSPDYPQLKERVAKQHTQIPWSASSNQASIPQRQDKPMAIIPSRDYPSYNHPAQSCSGRRAKNEASNPLQGRVMNPTDSAPNPHHSTSSSSLPSSTKRPLLDNKPRTPEERKQKDEAIRNMTERVICLRREKDMVFQKIQEAREDERLRHQLQLQKHVHSHRKEALLETLNDLKHKLEEQSKLLKKKDDSKGGDT